MRPLLVATVPHRTAPYHAQSRCCYHEIERRNTRRIAEYVAHDIIIIIYSAHNLFLIHHHGYHLSLAGWLAGQVTATTTVMGTTRENRRDETIACECVYGVAAGTAAARNNRKFMKSAFICEKLRLCRVAVSCSKWICGTSSEAGEEGKNKVQTNWAIFFFLFAFAMLPCGWHLGHGDDVGWRSIIKLASKWFWCWIIIHLKCLRSMTTIKNCSSIELRDTAAHGYVSLGYSLTLIGQKRRSLFIQALSVFKHYSYCCSTTSALHLCPFSFIHTPTFE